MLFKSYKKNIGQRGGASQWRVCYQRGLPRVVSSTLISFEAFKPGYITIYIPS